MVLFYVLPTGLEPVTLTGLRPKRSAYANSATGAYIQQGKLAHLLFRHIRIKIIYIY